MQMSARHKMGRNIVISDHAHMRCRQREIATDELRNLLRRFLDGPILPGVYRKRFATLTVVYEQTCDCLRVITVYQARKKKKVKRVTEVAEHIQRRTLHEIVITPDHVKRTESAEFRQSKERLKADGHYKCWVCGITESLQAHHYGIEWSLANAADWDVVKAFCEEWDPYGYGRLLRNQPMTSADDIRNMLILCQEHHTGVDHADGGSGTGIHEMTFPVWLVQKLAKPGEDLVPQVGETEEKAETSVTD